MYWYCQKSQESSSFRWRVRLLIEYLVRVRLVIEYLVRVKLVADYLALV